MPLPRPIALLLLCSQEYEIACAARESLGLSGVALVRSWEGCGPTVVVVLCNLPIMMDLINNKSVSNKNVK